MSKIKLREDKFPKVSKSSVAQYLPKVVYQFAHHLLTSKFYNYLLNDYVFVYI